MVMTALAWDLKAWFALMLRRACPDIGNRTADKVWLLGWSQDVCAGVSCACRAIVRTSRRVVYGCSHEKPHQPIFFPIA